MTEVGPVTFECPTSPGVLHVMEESFLAEVIDPETQAPVIQPPAAPPKGPQPETGPPRIRSGRGELVLTTLDRLGTPLLRYRTATWSMPSVAMRVSAVALRCVCAAAS